MLEELKSDIRKNSLDPRPQGSNGLNQVRGGKGSSRKLASERNIGVEVDTLKAQVRTVKGAYEILSTHHDTVVSKVKIFEKDTNTKNDQIVKLKFQNKHLLEQLNVERNKPKGVEEVIVVNMEKTEITPENILENHQMDFLKFQREEAPSARFSMYVKEDLDK